MSRRFQDYSNSYKHAMLERDDGGVLTIRLHTEGGPLVWGDGPHSELPEVFTDVGADSGNRVVILTGTGDRFIRELDDSWVGAMTPVKWSKIYSHGQRLLERLLEIPVPVIGVLNGPATVHAELAVLSDIVLIADDAYLSDAPHFRFGTVPGDGVHIIWPMLLGTNRGRYFLLTGQRLTADEAHRLGVVNEVMPREELLPRARALAANLAQKPETVLRYTRDVLVHPIRRALLDGVSHGLALEGLGVFESWPSGDAVEET